MTEHGIGGARWWTDPAREEARQAQHALLIDLLGAYVDEELPPETASQLDAHLVGCARCRREVQLQLALRDQLSATPVAPVRSALRDRIFAATATLPPVPTEEPVLTPVAPGRPWRVALVAWLVVALLAIGGAAAWAVRTFEAPGMHVARLSAPTASVPLLAEAVMDYRRLAGADLPGPARDLESVRAAVGFPVEPLTGTNLRLLGAWTTTLAGETAAVLAYRWDDRLVVQYIVPDQLFFRHPAIRSAAAAHRAVGATAGSVGVVAWPVTAAGSLLVGDGTPERLVGALAR